MNRMVKFLERHAPLIRRVVEFLGDHKPLCVPVEIALCSIWIFLGTIGWAGHFGMIEEINEQGGEAGYNLLSLICGCSFISLWLAFVIIVQASSRYYNPAVSISLGAIVAVVASCIATLVCGIGFVVSLLCFRFLAGLDNFLALINILRVDDVMLDTGPTLLAAGMILAAYVLLGVFLGSLVWLKRSIQKTVFS